MSTLNELALKVAKEVGWPEFEAMYVVTARSEILEFAHRLVAELAKQEPVATVGSHFVEYNGDYTYAIWADEINPPEKGTKLYAAPVIPAGWVIVPEEPTEEMLNVGADAMYDAVGHRGAACYKAMIAARPKP